MVPQNQSEVLILGVNPLEVAPRRHTTLNSAVSLKTWLQVPNLAAPLQLHSQVDRETLML